MVIFGPISIVKTKIPFFCCLVKCSNVVTRRILLKLREISLTVGLSIWTRDITRSAPGREDRSPITVLGAAGRGGGRGGGYHFIRRSDHFKHPHRPLATTRLTCRYWPEMGSSLLPRDTITHGHCSQCVGTVCLWQDFMLSTSTILSLQKEVQIQGCGRKRVLSLAWCFETWYLELQTNII